MLPSFVSVRLKCFLSRRENGAINLSSGTLKRSFVKITPTSSTKPFQLLQSTLFHASKICHLYSRRSLKLFVLFQGGALYLKRKTNCAQRPVARSSRRTASDGGLNNGLPFCARSSKCANHDECHRFRPSLAPSRRGRHRIAWRWGSFCFSVCYCASFWWDKSQKHLIQTASRCFLMLNATTTTAVGLISILDLFAPIVTDAGRAEVLHIFHLFRTTLPRV